MPRPFTLAIVLLTSLAASPLAQAEETRRPITHEDPWLMPRVGAPEISPDGLFAVFPVAAPAYDSDEQASHLGLVATDGGEPPRQLTFVRGTESGASWSPDSRNDADSRRISEEEDAGSHEALTYTGFPIRNWNRWPPERQPRLLVQTLGEDEAEDPHQASPAATRVPAMPRRQAGMNRP